MHNVSRPLLRRKFLQFPRITSDSCICNCCHQSPVFDCLCSPIPCLCAIKHILTVSSLIETDVSVQRIVVIYLDEVNPGKKLNKIILKLWNNWNVDYATGLLINMKQLQLIIYTFPFCSLYKPTASTSRRLAAGRQTHDSGRGILNWCWKWDRRKSTHEYWCG